MKDPLALLRMDAPDLSVAQVVVAEAARLHDERQEAVLKAQARLIRNEIAQMLK